MGKNSKQKGKQKASNVFKVAGAKATKAKNKTKPVTTNLKKLNVNTKHKTEVADARFLEVQDGLLVNKKDTKKSTIIPKKQSSRDNCDEMPDMDIAADEFAKL